MVSSLCHATGWLLFQVLGSPGCSTWRLCVGNGIRGVFGLSAFTSADGVCHANDTGCSLTHGALSMQGDSCGRPRCGGKFHAESVPVLIAYPVDL